jgi:hypothetical protein
MAEPATIFVASMFGAPEPAFVAQGRVADETKLPGRVVRTALALFGGGFVRRLGAMVMVFVLRVGIGLAITAAEQGAQEAQTDKVREG